MDVMDALCCSWIIGTVYLIMGEFFSWKNSC